ncbi:MAG: hypothetical protein Fur006_69590 [Coleofasciculaceae cyanobacterium]
MINFLVEFIPHLLLLIAMGLIVYLVQIIREQRRSSSRPNRRRIKRVTARKAIATARSPVNRHTQHTLLGMVGNDKALARRLVSSAQAGRPGQSENWYWEKAIYDLQRDRR